MNPEAAEAMDAAWECCEARKREPSSLGMLLASVLENCSSHCLDNAAERAVVAERLEVALLARPDALMIRNAFAHAPTSCGRLIVVASSTGDKQSRLIDAAYRLAGGA